MPAAAQFTDSHCHLDLCGDPDQAIAEAAAAGVSRIIAVGFDLETSRRAVDIAGRHAGVSAAVGIHPHDAAGFDATALEELSGLARDPAVVAVGETGLDYYRDRSPRAAQKKAFISQIELARREGLTLMVHTRDAAKETLEILGDHAGGLRTILHCFSLYGQVEECARRGYFMSVAGNVTYPKATELKEAAAAIPAGLLLAETDAPWLTPVPHRGKPNRPALVPLVTTELARLRREAVEELAAQVLANFQAAFPQRG